MLTFLKSLFGTTPSPSRQLTDPSQLQVGDLLVWTDSFGVPPDIRQQKFEVTAIQSYQFEHQYSLEYQLRSATNQHYYLSLQTENGESVLTLSRALTRAQVERCFSLDDIAQIFDGQGQAQFAPTDASEFDGWLAQRYSLEVFAEKAYWLDGDYRRTNAGAHQSLDYYYLSGVPDGYGLEAEVYDHGETELYLSLHRPISDICELWPGPS